MINQKNITIEDFQILSVLGDGSFSNVVLARKLDSGELTAIKIVKKMRIKNEKLKEHIQLERDIMAECDHPFIMPLYYAFQDKSNLSFVMQYCPGGELFQLIKRMYYFSEDMARFYAAQIVLAFEYLHDKGYVYTDLKPENILIDSNGYLKLTDFGLSSKLVKGVAGYHPIGTLEYMAPEMFSKRGYGIPVDWYSLGCLIYEMVTGSVPFRGQGTTEIVSQIIGKNPSLPDYMSQSLKSLLTKLLWKFPADRLGSGPGGVDEIKNHPWFSGINWNLLLEQKLKPPFIPAPNCETDLCYFDSTFKNKPVSALFCPSPFELFKLKDFTYIHPSKLSEDKAETGSDIMRSEGPLQVA